LCRARGIAARGPASAVVGLESTTWGRVARGFADCARRAAPASSSADPRRPRGNPAFPSSDHPL